MIIVPKPLFSLLVPLFFISSSCIGQENQTEGIKNLVEKLNSVENYRKIDGLLISQHGEIIMEEYFNGFTQDDPHQTRSSFKTITSLLAGIAVDQGLFTVNDSIKDYIPEWKNDARGNIQIKDLLEMRSGLACENFFEVGPDCENEMYNTKDWLGYIMDIPKRYEPGKNWEYSSMEPDLVGIIIYRTSKLSLMDFADKYLFGPLGIEVCQWEITPDGRGYAAGSSRMKPDDLLKITQMVLDEGKWKGKQIVSKKWIEESTNCHIDLGMSFLDWSGIKNPTIHNTNYGYFWYSELLEYGDFKTEVTFASGNGGQYMMILKEYDVAIVFTGSNYGNWKSKLPFEIIVKYFEPIIEEGKK